MLETPARQAQYIADAWYAPVIGIPCAWSVAQARRFAPVWGAYTQVIAQAGGIPLWLPLGADVAALAPLVLRLDGFLLPGGTDIYPACYGEAPCPRLGTVDPEADRLELWLAREALTADLPLLGVNRGLHVMNVVLGGSLYQDLRSQLKTPLCHATTDQPRAAIAHAVDLVPGTRLVDLLGVPALGVNSLHHQGIKDLGADLDIAAMAPDDVIEAIEVRGKKFALGVQWAAEAQAVAGEARMHRLFQGFVEAARTAGMERRRRDLHARASLQRWEQMWVGDLLTYAEGKRRLLGGELLPALEELELRRDLPVLKGRLQATAQALNLSDPTPPAGRL